MVASPSRTSATPQAGAMPACDWNGHSYVASTVRAALAPFAAQLVFVGGLGFPLAVDGEVVAHLVVPLEGHVEGRPADQLAIGYVLVGIAVVADDAVRDRQPLGRHAELFGRHFEE